MANKSYKWQSHKSVVSFRLGPAIAKTFHAVYRQYLENCAKLATQLNLAKLA